MQSQEVTAALLTIIENPSAQKGYRDLKKYFEKCGRVTEAEALDYLIQKRFGHVGNTDSSQKQ